MLPPKIGEGVLGSSSGGVNPTGASSSLVTGAASVFSSAALITVLDDDLKLRGLKEKDMVDWLLKEESVEEETGGVKREAWEAMAMV